MDIYCSRCGEPWDNDTFHDVAAERSDDEGRTVTYTEVIADFRQRGCAAIPGERECERRDSLRTQAMEAMWEVMGDDVDGIASTMDDFEFMGMLDDPQPQAAASEETERDG